jgi:RNA polymerase sigma-70 factor (ECF subfamily)
VGDLTVVAILDAPVSEILEPLASEPADVAIPRLFEEHGGLLLALGRRFCGNDEDARDLVQEVLLSAWKSWDRFDGRSQAKTWLYTIAARACQRRHRKRAGEPDHMASLDDLLPGREAHSPDLRSPDDDAFQLQVKRETREAVEAAISRLPFDFRITLVLKDIVELSVADVARILDIKPATVKTRVHRARLQLREQLCERFPDCPSPAPGQPAQVCYDLLRAKLDALDRGVELEITDPDLCGRCAAVFHQLDLAKEACGEIFSGPVPPDLLASVRQALDSGTSREP